MANEIKEKFKTTVGGQALMEGVMMRGPKAMCIAVRRPDGGIETEVTPVVMKPWQKWPFVRGIYNMAENLVVGYRCLMRSADISMTEE